MRSCSGAGPRNTTPRQQQQPPPQQRPPLPRGIGSMIRPLCFAAAALFWGLPQEVSVAALRMPSVLRRILPPRGTDASPPPVPQPQESPYKTAPASLKQSLLESISGTSNGKSATRAQQARVLALVGQLEAEFPPPATLLSDATVTGDLLDGTWYLQYTSPSDLGVEDAGGEGTAGAADAFPNVWKPQSTADDARIPASGAAFRARGTVAAAGLTVETANRVVTQTIDVAGRRVTNDVGLDWGRVRVGGRFRASPVVPTRAVVAFDTARVEWERAGLALDLGLVFRVLALFRGTDESGWLETTYIDRDVRIGRGNKGTLFVLTRDFTAVRP